MLAQAEDVVRDRDPGLDVDIELVAAADVDRPARGAGITSTDRDE